MKIHTRILYALAAGLFCLAVSGCTHLDHWKAAGASTTIGAYYGDLDQEQNNSKRSWEGREQGLTLTVQPFAYWDMTMRAEANARAIVEKRYREGDEIGPVAASKPLPPKPPCCEAGARDWRP